MWCNFEKVFKICVVDPWHFDQISSKCSNFVWLTLQNFTKFHQNVKKYRGWLMKISKICAKLLKIHGLVLVIIAKFNQKCDLSFVEKCLFFQRIDAYKRLHYFLHILTILIWKNNQKTIIDGTLYFQKLNTN